MVLTNMPSHTCFLNMFLKANSEKKIKISINSSQRSQELKEYSLHSYVFFPLCKKNKGKICSRVRQNIENVNFCKSEVWAT